MENQAIMPFTKAAIHRSPLTTHPAPTAVSVDNPAPARQAIPRSVGEPPSAVQCRTRRRVAFMIAMSLHGHFGHVQQVAQQARWIGACTLVLALSARSQPPPQPEPTGLVRIQNGIVTVGVHRGMGGSISWLSWTEHPQNVVNHSDPGRLIQQSYYAGRPLDRRSEGQSPHWSPWPWNPIQGGGFGSWAHAKILQRMGDGSLFGETAPKLWDMPNETAAAIMRQWTGFEPALSNTVVVRCEFIALRNPTNDRWGVARASPQEIPACYFTREFDRVRSYLGDGQWRDEIVSPGPPWRRASPPRNAMAVFNADGRGIAVFSPAATQPWNYGVHGPPQPSAPEAGPCVHLAPIDRALMMGPRFVYRYRYWLVVGTAAEVAASLDHLLARHANERADVQPQPPPQDLAR